ncbi:MAG: hypothetical protein A4E73_00792 [Syntrophaceae bacterium PtaU1.Bin231]|nr:MAG: hypothetical protein A4E73_00792 [Syntrophaceae bacterium PtaU1.Bin231]
MSLSRTASSTPPASPARTMLTYSLEKMSGCFWRASEKEMPSRTDFSRAWTISFIPLRSEISEMTWRLLSRGSPAASRVESSDVKVIRSLFVARNRILDPKPRSAGGVTESGINPMFLSRSTAFL